MIVLKGRREKIARQVADVLIHGDTAKKSFWLKSVDDAIHFATLNAPDYKRPKFIVMSRSSRDRFEMELHDRYLFIEGWIGDIDGEQFNGIMYEDVLIAAGGPGTPDNVISMGQTLQEAIDRRWYWVVRINTYHSYGVDNNMIKQVQVTEE